VRLDQAAVEINAEDFKSGMSTLQSIIRSNEAKQAAAWLILADSKLYFGEAAQAEDILRDAIKRFPDDPRPYAELARAYLFADRIAEGKTEADRAVAKDPNSYLARIARGDLARLEGNGIAANSGRWIRSRIISISPKPNSRRRSNRIRPTISRLPGAASSN
jgi:predicted Zn-dependent protease